jgi:hypothetical protein
MNHSNDLHSARRGSTREAPTLRRTFFSSPTRETASGWDAVNHACQAMFADSSGRPSSCIRLTTRAPASAEQMPALCDLNCRTQAGFSPPSDRYDDSPSRSMTERHRSSHRSQSVSESIGRVSWFRSGFASYADELCTKNSLIVAVLRSLWYRERWPR